MSKWSDSLVPLASRIGCLKPLLVAGCLLALAPTPANAVSSTFDAGLEGWSAWGFDVDVVFGFPPRVVGLTLVPNAGDMVHNATQGNPDGYARLTDAIEEPSSFARAPASYLGDLSAFSGGTFSFEHKLFTEGLNVRSIGPYSLIIISGSPFDFNALVWTAPAPAGATPWVHFDITLDMTDLTLIENANVSLIYPASPISGTVGGILGVSATMTPAQIMANVSDILVGFEIVNNQGLQNSEHGGIDNVNMVAAGPADPLCGDVDNDLDLDSDDVSTFRRFLSDPIGSPLTPAGAQRCKVIVDSSSEPRNCDMLDVVVLRRAIGTLPPGVTPVCDAVAGPQSI